MGYEQLLVIRLMSFLTLKNLNGGWFVGVWLEFVFFKM